MMNFINKLTLAAAITIFAASCGQSPNNSRTQSSATENTEQKTSLNIGGTYSFGDGAEKGQTGSVMIYPLSDNSALFYLDVCLGAPSYNSGTLFGEITITENIGFYDSNIDNEFLNCLLKFEFSSNQLKITTDTESDDCGFGHGIDADHIYKLKDASIPEYYENMEGNRIMFKDLVNKQ